MGAHLLEGDLHLPALQVGGEDGGRGPVGVGAEQGLGLPASARVAQEQPAQGHGGLARVVPESRAGGGLEASLGAVGPALAQGGPLRVRVGRHRLQGGLTGAHDPRPPLLARLAGRGRIMQDGIQAQPGQEGDGRGHGLAGGQQLQGGVGPVRDHQVPVGQPAAQQAQHLAGPVRDGLVAAAAGLVIAPGGGQHGQEGQGPHPLGPGHVGQQH